MRLSVLFFVIPLVAASIVGCSDSSDAIPASCPATDPNNPGNRLVVVGHSFPSGFHDSNVFPESQRWVYPSYIAERLDAEYSAPELQLGMAWSGITTPDQRSLFSSTGILTSPYFGIADLPPYDTKLFPEELHTNLAVPGALLSEVLQYNIASADACGPGGSPCLFHFALNGSPYTGLVDPTGVTPSQVDIAVHLKPKWILVNIGGNDLSAQVDPKAFEKDYRELLNRLTKCNAAARVIVANTPYEPTIPGYVTADEADQLYGFSPGTTSQAYYQETGIVPGPEDRMRLTVLSNFLLGLSLEPPPLTTLAEQGALEELKDKYNQAIHRLAREFGAIVWDHEKFSEDLMRTGIMVTIDGKQYQLTNEYGGGLWSFQATHVGKTVHASAANSIINTLNREAPGDGGGTCQLPLVDVNTAACTDLHVRRAVGLAEDPNEFSCPLPSEVPPCGG